MCSRAMFVRATAASGWRTLVASQRPPRPASIAIAATPARRKAQNAIAVRASNWVTGSPAGRAGPPAASRTAVAASAKAASPIGSPPTWTRSAQSPTWGDR